jgi:aminoglycoside phosphotransferase
VTTALLAPSPVRDLVEVINDRNWRIAVLGASRDPNAKLTVLVMPAERGVPPHAAIKVPTTARAAAAVAGERRILEALHRLRCDVIEETVPQVLDVVTAAGFEAMVQSALPGTPLTTLYLRWWHTRSPKRVARDLGAVGAWLNRLQDETAGACAPVEMDAGVTDTLCERYGGGPNVERAVRLVHASCARLRSHSAPRTVVHGDFWCGNVLLERDRISGVIDWEHAELAGEPLRDLARFALTYAMYLDRHARPGRQVRGHPGLRASEWGCGIDYLLFGGGWICDLLRTFLRLGLRRLGVPGERWSDAIIAGTAEVAANTDDEGFGRSHVDVLARIARRTSTARE